MSYMESAMERQYEAWMEQEREWYELSNQLMGEGWHYCRLHRMINSAEQSEMIKWLNERYYGRYEWFNDEFVFLTEQDAMWFLMRWS